MRYVVTGAAGFIGSHLGATLRAAGHDVVGLDCFTDYYDPALKENNARTLAGLGIEVQRVDLAEDDFDFSGADGVFHLAGQPGVRSFGDVFATYLRRNLLASQRVFEAAVRDGVKVVFASSSSIYGAAERYPTAEDTPPSPLSPYGITKLGCEQLAAAYTREFAWCCGTSTRSARGSGLTWRSRGSPSPWRPAARSSCSATARSPAAGPTSAMSSTGRSPRWNEAPARTTSAVRSRPR
jgi:nucleoside-diphosphate-sugar epimerase